MKELPTSSQEYRALKRYWKLLLTPLEQLDFMHFHKWTNFSNWLTATDVVRNLLETNPELKKAHAILSQIRSALQNNDWNSYNAAFWNTTDCPEELITTLKVLESHHDEIKNTFTTVYSNGPLEGTNNKIKLIKRTSFGYRSFFRFRTRILFAMRFQIKRTLITK